MSYKFYFSNIKDADYFCDSVVEIAKQYGTIRLSDLYDLTGEASDYLSCKYIWTKDTIIYDMTREFDSRCGYYVEFPEPDQHPAPTRISYKDYYATKTPRSTVYTKKPHAHTEPIHITILTDNIENVDEVIDKVIERANQIKDRIVSVTIS